MKTKDFSFELPDELIAQHPADRRDDARLLVVDRTSGSITHSRVRDLVSHLPTQSVLVLNDSKVRKARLYGRPIDGESAGSVEFLLFSPDDGFCRWHAVVRRAKRQRVGRRYRFPGNRIGEITAAEGAVRTVRFDQSVDDSYLEEFGAVPLPPYIKRVAEAEDEERYQTVYARTYGSVAAPTAGFHFTPELLSAVEDGGHQIETITLHVGLGTFTPVRSESVEEHSMHTEEYEIGSKASRELTRAKRAGRPVVAVGTTSVRTLESAVVVREGGVEFPAGRGSTDIFIHPPHEFRAVDALFTNFHTPESTLLMLVAAFAGLDLIQRAYREAVAQRYRFFSYGDAMLIQ